MEYYDIGIIGGGAAGLMAAVCAAQECRKNRIPARIAVLEANPRVGKKLLATGNGRCNLTNRNLSAEHYHGDTDLAMPLFKKYTPQRIIDQFSSLGLLCREREEGRIYPNNLQASAVLDILRFQLESLGVKTLTDFPAAAVKKTGAAFTVHSQSGTVSAKRLIFACGGKAYPQLGSNGNGYPILKSLGHSVTGLFPALVQVKTDPARAKPLKGARSAACATLLAGGKPVKTVCGEVQFTENGLSGICIFELSRLAGELKAEKKLEIALDLLPDYTEEEVFAMLQALRKTLGLMPAEEFLGGCVNKLVGRGVIRAALRRIPRQANEYRTDDLKAIAKTVKDFRFEVTGTLSWKDAQVTAGGVPLKEVDENLQSRFCPGLYLAGELLNIDGDCGGFNLHWAWSTGMAAGTACALSLRKK
ncbi:MAG: Aminoacetone oxidase family FAD-binding enzyme [Eubacteriales bacterium]|jgi:predicted Rossmann fold flavoprotein